MTPMTIWEVMGLVLKLTLSLWDYFRGKADTKAAATAVLAKTFADLEAQGYPVMQEILIDQGRAAWIPWDKIPLLVNPNVKVVPVPADVKGPIGPPPTGASPPTVAPPPDML